MSEGLRYSLVFLVIFLTHFQEGVTGFGCTVLALPFITLLLGLDAAVPVLVIQAWVLVLYIVLESRRRIVWIEYLHIVLLAGVGMPFGMWMSRALPEKGLKWVLAAFMLAVGIHGLWKHMRKQTSEKQAMDGRTKWLVSTALPIGGVIHGAFASGGPLLVIYATKALQDKTLFRVTLCLVWLTLNTAKIAELALGGKITGPVLVITALCMPFTIIGMIIGNTAHYRMNELLFRRLVYGVLVASGFALIWSIIG